MTPDGAAVKGLVEVDLDHPVRPPAPEEADAGQMPLHAHCREMNYLYFLLI